MDHFSAYISRLTKTGFICDASNRPLIFQPSHHLWLPPPDQDVMRLRDGSNTTFMSPVKPFSFHKPNNLYSEQILVLSYNHL